jgi:hypothetical protein
MKISNIAELKTRRGTAGFNVNVLGYYTNGDGGGGEFYWDNTSTETDNGGTIIKVTGLVTGRWKRIYSTEINVKWFGTKEDGIINDTFYIQSAIDFASVNLVNTVIFNSKTYLIDGEANPCPSGNGGVRLKNNVNVFFNNTFIQVKNSSTGIYSALNFYDSSNNNIFGFVKITGDNLSIAEYGHGLYFSKCKDIAINGKIDISNFSGDGMYFGELNAGNPLYVPENVSVLNFSISNSGRNGISITGGKRIYIKNGVISGSYAFVPKRSIDIEVNNNLEINTVIFEDITTFNSTSGEVLITRISSSNLGMRNIKFIDCNFTSSASAKVLDIRYSEVIHFIGCTFTGYTAIANDSIFDSCNFYLTSTNGSNDYFIYSNILSKVLFNKSYFSIKDNRFIYDNVGGSVIFDICTVIFDRTNSTLLPDSTNIFGDATSNQIFTSINSTWTLLFTPSTSFGYSGSDFNGVNKKFLNSFVSDKLINDSHVKFNMNQIHPVLSAVPSTGTYQTGAVIYFRNPSAGGFIGAVCISGGTSGTWKAFGVISA